MDKRKKKMIYGKLILSNQQWITENRIRKTDTGEYKIENEYWTLANQKLHTVVCALWGDTFTPNVKNDFSL